MKRAWPAGDRVPGGGEDAEERVSLCIDLDAAMGRHGFADEPVVLAQRLRIPFRAVLRERASRPLDVGEEEGERAARQARLHANNFTPVVFEVRHG
jgi:D-serine deaminase-like pyridoxal phosphate-dependent protein